MRPMLSIDFGNSYTKVALRLDADNPSQLVTDPSLKLDELHACVPTLAACYTKGAKEEWYFGTDVMKFREETPGLAVYRNWKPRFFELDGEGQRSPRNYLGESAAESTKGKLQTLAVPPGLTPEAWETIVSDLPPEQIASLWKKLRGRNGEQNGLSPGSEETDLDHKHIGRGFFQWLYDFVDPVCQKRAGCSAATIPARVSLPSFGSMTKAELLLEDILAGAGWQLDERVTCLPEPLSNAIGAFTEGINATNNLARETSPHYGKMFGNTGMLARMRTAILDGGPKTAWVLIVDVGGYTADFAMIGLNLDDIDSRLEGTIDGKPRLAHNSKPLGVTDLDSRIRDLLPQAKREALDQVIRDPDQQRLEAFHKNCFGYVGQYAIRNTMVVGGTASEKKQIRDAVNAFGEEIADDAEDFLSVYQYDQIDDLILTGGGTMMPAVRESLGKRLSHYGVKKVHLHLAKGESPKFSIPYHSLGSTLVRGATAVGGASLYFDYAES